MAVHGPQKHGPATRAKMSKKTQELLNDPIRSPAYRATRSKTIRAMHANPVLSPAIKTKRLRSLKATQDKRTLTKWRHALRHPFFVAYRKKVEAMLPEGNNLRHIDRLEKSDAIDKTGLCRGRN